MTSEICLMENDKCTLSDFYSYAVYREMNEIKQINHLDNNMITRYQKKRKNWVE